MYPYFIRINQTVQALPITPLLKNTVHYWTARQYAHPWRLSLRITFVCIRAIYRAKNTDFIKNEINGKNNIKW